MFVAINKRENYSHKTKENCAKKKEKKTKLEGFWTSKHCSNENKNNKNFNLTFYILLILILLIDRTCK